MESNQILKFALIGGAAYLAYTYLEKSGLWAQWFGGAQTFTDANSLLAFCNSNPTGQASYNGQTAACSAWIQAAKSSSTTTTPPAATPPTAPTVDPNVVNADVSALLALAQVSATQLYNPDQWNYYWAKMGKPSADNAIAKTYWAQGRPSDPTQYPQITAQQFVQTIAGQGISGLGLAATLIDPYRWVN